MKQVEPRIDQMDTQINGIDRRLDQISDRFDQMDRRIEQVDRRIERLETESELSRRQIQRILDRFSTLRLVVQTEGYDSVVDRGREHVLKSNGR